MIDVPLADALLLWNSGLQDSAPAFAVRPLGHDDYYRYDSQGGACFAAWRDMEPQQRRERLLVDVWHIVAFDRVPVQIVHDGLLAIPEYRSMLADDCLPKQFQHERNG